MAPQQFFTVIIIMIVGAFLLNLYKINTRVKCTFRGRNKKLRTKWAKPQNGERIEFDKGWYYVRTECIIHDRIFFNLLPVILLEFSYRSKYPNNPDTGEPLEETAEMRKNLNKREDIEALEMGSAKAFGRGGIAATRGGWIPVLTVIGLVAAVYLLWQLIGRVDMLGQAVNVLQQMQMGK